MTKHINLDSWTGTIAKHMPHLSHAQIWGLSLWSFAIVMTDSCGLTTVSVFIAKLLGKSEMTTRQHLREWYKNKESKKGKKRAELDVKTCFGPLLGWILSWWPTDDKRLALAVDASTLGQRFTVLLVCVVYRGCGIPVAWKIVEATAKGAWKPHWQGLLENLKDHIGPDWLVIVTSDRGLYADWLYHAIVALGWHPFMRINLGGKFRALGAEAFRPLTELVEQTGQFWSGEATCFKSNPLECTLLGWWGEGYKEPWLIVTDLAPHQADICWYGMRSWIEGFFKDSKRGGWQWHQTKMTDPKRAERLWLAIAVATLWVVSVGGEEDATLPVNSFAPPPAASSNPLQNIQAEPQSKNPDHQSLADKDIPLQRHFEPLPEKPDTQPQKMEGQLDALPETNSPLPYLLKKTASRYLSCFRRGMLTIRAAFANQQPLPLGRFISEPWPSSLNLPPLNLANASSA